jgi:hypothetical protein
LTRPKAFFINGGAGRVICSIPAFEKYAETHNDFIIVCEGGTDFFKGHPILHKHVYDVWHKGLFEDHLKHRDLITPEPYRVWEYFNQKCSLAQAFDIIINEQGIQELPDPTIYLNKMEMAAGFNMVQEVKAKTGFDKIVVVQPFGRSVQNMGEFIIDPSSRSFHLNDIVEIVNELKKEYGVILMSEFPIALEETETGKYPVAMPQIPDIRIWAGIIDVADHFVGCDSVGQHIAKSLGKTATVVVGSTFPVNITYPEDEDFDIFDIGDGKRVYSPIRISMEDALDRYNDECMEMTIKQRQDVLHSIRRRLGKSVKFKGKFVPPQQAASCCAPGSTTPSEFVQSSQPKFSADASLSRPLLLPGSRQ